MKHSNLDIMQRNSLYRHSVSEKKQMLAEIYENNATIKRILEEREVLLNEKSSLLAKLKETISLLNEANKILEDNGVIFLQYYERGYNYKPIPKEMLIKEASEEVNKLCRFYDDDILWIPAMAEEEIIEVPKKVIKTRQRKKEVLVSGLQPKEETAFVRPKAEYSNIKSPYGLASELHNSNNLD